MGWHNRKMVPGSAVALIDTLTAPKRRKSVKWRDKEGTLFDEAIFFQKIYRKGIPYADLSNKMANQYPQYDWNTNVIAGAVRHLIRDHQIKYQKPNQPRYRNRYSEKSIQHSFGG